MLVRRAAMAIAMLAATPNLTLAGPRNTAVQPLPEVSEATIAPMATAFAEMPLGCRIAVQEKLQQHGWYRGVVDGRWSIELGQGLIAWVHETGNLAYGWPTVPGSKGILWSVAGDLERCPIELLEHI